MKSRDAGKKARSTKTSKSPSSKSPSSKPPASKIAGKATRRPSETVDDHIRIERTPPSDLEAYHALGEALAEAHPGAVAGVGAHGDSLMVFLTRSISKADADELKQLALEHDFSTRTRDQARVEGEKRDLAAFRERLSDLVDENEKDLSDVASGAASGKQTFSRILNREKKLLGMLRRVLTLVKDD